MLIGSTLLVVEVKFVPVASDAHEFWRVDQTLDDAADQLRKKVTFISSDTHSFLGDIHDRYDGPALEVVEDVIPLIVTSDAYHAGFCINEICVADLPILAVFFDNAFVEMQEVAPDGIKERTVSIYRDAADAVTRLNSYLCEPEIVKRLRRQIVPRELAYRTNLFVNETEELTVTLRSVEVSPLSASHG